MKHLIVPIACVIMLISSCAQSQTNEVGGPCQGCEAVNEYRDKKLKFTDTIYGFDTKPNRIKISGIVYKNDGKTPAKDVILYIYHTDETGRYPKRSSSTGWENIHGYLRTWLKTDANGKYEFYTTRPASYPNTTIPQHIHVTVKEPKINAYYIEDFYFADDPNITANIINRAKPRGGSGVIQLQGDKVLQTATRTIILGLNIPNY